MSNEYDGMDTTRLRHVLAEAVAELDPDDRAARRAWCAEHATYGIRTDFALDEFGWMMFHWGGAELCRVHPNALRYGGALPEMS